MTAQNSNRALQILTGVLALLLIGLGIYTYQFYSDEKQIKADLKKEKQIIESELNELITKYDNAIALNESMDEHLLSAKERIAQLLDSVKNNEANLALISKYRRQIGRLKQERDRLFKLADSLTNENSRLATDLDSTNNALTVRTMLSDSLQSQNQQLSDRIEVGALLSTTNLRANGVKVKNSGKLVETDRISRTDKVQVCFTLAENKLTEVGDKELFVQVINPEGNMIGEKQTVEFEEASLTYSGRNKVYYENAALDVCMLVDAPEADLQKGNYVVHVFSDSKMIANTEFELR